MLGWELVLASAQAPDWEVQAWAMATAWAMGLVSVKAQELATDLRPEPRVELSDYPTARKLRHSPTAQSSEPEQKPLPAGVLTILTTW